MYSVKEIKYIIKTQSTDCVLYLILAKDMRFELTEACTSPPFQDGALNRSANPSYGLLYKKYL